MGVWGGGSVVCVCVCACVRACVCVCVCARAGVLHPWLLQAADKYCKQSVLCKVCRELNEIRIHERLKTKAYFKMAVQNGANCSE